jgi:lipoprotein-anchoring transpeptidase ErfK/SrfK
MSHLTSSRIARFARVIATAVALSLTSGFAAHAAIVVDVNKATQTMTVTVDGQVRYTWKVSTGTDGHGTPNGTYRPRSLQRFHWSTIYNDAPMPYSIFFRGNYAIHATTAIRRLGGRASHGCVRLHPKNAAILFALVSEQPGNTRIVIR